MSMIPPSMDMMLRSTRVIQRAITIPVKVKGIDTSMMMKGSVHDSNWAAITM